MKLGDICSKIGSGATPRGGKDSYKDSGTAIIRSQNVLDWSFSSSGLAFIDDDQSKALSNVEVKQGDVLLNITGDSVARACMVPSEFLPARVNQHVAIIRANEEANNLFLLAWLQANKGTLLKLASSGATRNALTKRMLENLDVNLPSIDVQNKVAAFIDSIQAKITLNARLNGYLLELMNVQYQHSFCCNKLTLGSIYDIADVVYGAAFKSALFNEEKVGYPLIRIRDLSTFSPQYWTNEAHPKRVFVHPGDVLAGMDAEFTPCLWQGEMAVLNQRVCLFEPAANSGVSRSYLLMALNPLLAFIQNYASGTTVAHMGKGDLEALNVPIPARGDLERFNTIAEPLREQIVQNSTQNRKLAALRDALLPKLMSGEIDVSRVDFTQLNSHLAETLRPFGCHIPAIQKTGQLALLRTAPYPRPSRCSNNQHRSPTSQIAHPADRGVWASPLGRNPRRRLQPGAVARRLHGARSGTGTAI